MDDDDNDCLTFWRHNRVNLNNLVYPAIPALSVPAASSAEEHVFSHGGVILNVELITVKQYTLCSEKSDAKIQSL